MRILHTSDWHIGRTFFGEPVIAHLDQVLDALTTRVRELAVDVVVVAGDIFDSTTPAAWAFDFLTERLVALRNTGATVIVTSGNHDSAQRLRFQSLWARSAGVHVIAQPELGFEVVAAEDTHGPVRFYGVPYLEPALIRHLDGAEAVRSQADAMGWAIGRARRDLEAAPARAVLIGHCFAAGVPAAANAEDIERDLTAGGLDVVPLDAFAGFDYVALGHIHGRAELRPSIRYSGAPLHYSFSEAASPRGAWLVDLDENGYAGSEWVPLPIPRRLTKLHGTLDALLTDSEYEHARADWVTVSLTNQARPVDAMARLRARFPHAVHVEHTPDQRSESSSVGYAATLASVLTDEERIEAFLQHTRNGKGATPAEQGILAEVFAEYRKEEASK